MSSYSYLFKRISLWWQIVGITILLFLFINICFYCINKITGIDEFEKNKFSDERIHADCYQKAEWVKKYFYEFQESMIDEWSSYVYFRREPYLGEFINIDSNGIRKTFNTLYHEEIRAQVKRIFIFGGSTIWGTGSRDSMTIPSQLSYRLNKHNLKCEITNYGESGFVSTQEILRLYLELRKGNVPDLVVIYNGVNDVYSTYQQGRPGLPQNEYNRIDEFNILKRSKYRYLKKRFWHERIENIAIIRFSLYYMYRIMNKKQVYKELKGFTSDHLAEETAASYLHNMRLLEAQSKEYGFKIAVFWQPAIFTKKYLSVYEKQHAEKMQDLGDFYKNTSLKVESMSDSMGLKYWYSCYNLLDTIPEPLYIDFCHLAEEGNKIITESMSKIIIPLFKEE